MDGRHFDRLTRALSEAGTRRGLLGLLTTLPVLGGLFTLLDLDDVDARGRRKRRKKKHKHGKGRRRKHHKKCNANSKGKTCNGKCGPIKNNCKKTVDCGSCDCDSACEACFTCQGEAGAPGSCVPQTAGTPCGEATCAGGALFPQGSCNGSGTCLPGTPVACAPYTQCDGDACPTTCLDDDDCIPGSFCDQDDHCVGDGGTGAPCVHGGQCESGFCVDDVCCVVAACDQCEACNRPGQEGTCAARSNGTSCDDGDLCTTGDTCQGGSCGGGTTICTEPPVCQTADGATCSGGACLYPPVAAGTPCDNPGSNFICLDNGSCGAITCPPTCPAGCECSGPTVPSRCYESLATTCPTAQACAGRTCPPGFWCLPCSAGPGGLRCIPLCTG